MATDQRFTVSLPEWFTEDMGGKLEAKIRKERGDDFNLESLDLQARQATFRRQVEVARVAGNEITLPAHLSAPSHGDRVAAMIEAQRPGYAMTVFDPHAGTAQFAKMTLDEVTARAAVAEALGAKPWDVGISTRRGGGFILTRIPSKYTPSRHDSKLLEVAETKVPGGKPGWFVTVDGATLTGEIVPSELPTFDAMYPYDMASLKTAHRDVIPFGIELPGRGHAVGKVGAIDLSVSASVLVAGLSNGGKSVTINALLVGALAGGSEICVIDTLDKSLDFLWCKDMVRPGGWGCESLEHSVAVVHALYEEGKRRSEWMKKNAPGVVNWLELPASQTFKPILLVFDEFSAVTDPEKVTGMSKDDPMRAEIEYENMLRSRTKRYTQKIMREMRFVGLRVIIASQVANAQTGLGPTDKAQMGHRFLCGPNPSPAAMTQAFNDPQAVPTVPANVKADKVAARGAGSYSSEGRAPAVFKSFYASSDDYRAALVKLGVPTTSKPEPSAAQVAAAVPDLGMEDDGPPPSALDRGGFGEVDGRDARPPKGLQGAARASHELKELLGDA